MAKDTSNALRSSLIYCIYPRAYGPNGKFADIQNDLDRIQDLGADILWLLPIHPVGGQNRKGTLGSPYAVRDYRAVNPEYGTLEDFTALLEAIHDRGMRCMIDVVYNHTSPDSVLAKQHPEWFYRTPDGRFGNRAGEWSDVIDLDYTHPALWEYQIETLCYWARIGVDGFRCDVASLVPAAFWAEARRRVAGERAGMVWLAESVHGQFLENFRHMGFEGYSDGELYEAFDITYDYDIHEYYEGHFAGREGIAHYLAAMRRQESAYPANFLKLRFLENHDHPRAAALLPDRGELEMWTAFQYLIKGTALLYAGQEALDTNTPSLFERDPVRWEGGDAAFTALLVKLAALRQHLLMREGAYFLRAAEGHPTVALVGYTGPLGKKLRGVFNLGGETGRVPVDLPDGTYENLLGGSAKIQEGHLALGNVPVWIEQA